MNWRFADFLIELADPARSQDFVRDPEAVMAAAGLSDADRLAIRTRNYGIIRYQAIHGDLKPVSTELMQSEIRDNIDFVHVEINHQTETSHDNVALHDDTIKRTYGPHMSFYPEDSNAA
jgi:hypothetical protein